MQCLPCVARLEGQDNSRAIGRMDLKSIIRTTSPSPKSSEQNSHSHSTKRVTFTEESLDDRASKKRKIVDRFSAAHILSAADVNMLMSKISTVVFLRSKNFVKCEDFRHLIKTKEEMIPLIDLKSSKRIQLPLRSTKCHHATCFDATSFFFSNVGLPYSSWSCPICNLAIKFEDLFVDGFIAHVLESEPVVVKNAKFVWVERSGRWRLKPKYSDSERPPEGYSTNFGNQMAKQSCENDVSTSSIPRTRSTGSSIVSDVKSIDMRSSAIGTISGESAKSLGSNILSQMPCSPPVLEPKTVVRELRVVNARRPMSPRQILRTSARKSIKFARNSLPCSRATSPYKAVSAATSQTEGLIISTTSDASPILLSDTKRFSSEFGWRFDCSKFSLDTRVLVVDEEPSFDRRVCSRSHEYIICMLTGAVVVSRNWMLACFDERQQIDLEPYRIVADSSFPTALPFTRRTPKMLRKRSLFKLFQFFIDERLDKTIADKIIQYIQLGGGKVRERKPVVGEYVNPAVSLWVCAPRSIDIGRCEGNLLSKMTPVISDWVRDSVSVFQCRPLGRYQLAAFEERKRPHPVRIASTLSNIQLSGRSAKPKSLTMSQSKPPSGVRPQKRVPAVRDMKRKPERGPAVSPSRNHIRRNWTTSGVRSATSARHTTSDFRRKRLKRMKRRIRTLSDDESSSDDDWSPANKSTRKLRSRPKTAKREISSVSSGSPPSDNDSNQFQIETILSEWVWIDPPLEGDQNAVDTGSWFELKWEGYGHDENTLQQLDTLTNCPDVLRHWEENNVLGSCPLP
eukprot:434761_1